MNLQVSSKRGVGKNEGEKKFHHSKSNAQKYSTSNSTTYNNLILTDKNEFPSLSEIYEKISDISFSSVANLSYSDKLKSTPLNHISPSKHLNKSNDKTLNVSKDIRKTEHDLIKKMNYNKTSIYSSQSIIKNKSTESKPSNAGTLENLVNSSHFQKQNFNSNHLPKEHCSNSLPKQENPVVTLSNSHVSTDILNDTKNVTQHVSCAFNYYNKSVKSNIASYNSNLEKGDGSKDCHVAKSKKKRKSKVKRQIAFQSGKITLLSPEIHSKILNQTSTPKLQNVKNNLTDIRNEEEYPELGVALVPMTEIQNKIQSISLKSQNEISGKLLDLCASSEFTSSEELSNEAVQTLVPGGQNTIENKPKSNKSVHPNDPITISIFDILSKDKIKGKFKTLKDDVIVPTNAKVSMRKEKTKKSICHPHNILDSAPALKRGKERENPKQKKPSQLKKLILLDRKTRQENFLMMKMNASEEEKMKETCCHGSYISDFESKSERMNTQFNDDLDVISDNLNSLNSLEDLSEVADDIQFISNDWFPDSLYHRKNLESNIPIDQKLYNKFNNCFFNDHVKNECLIDKTKICSQGLKEERNVTSELYLMKNTNVELCDSVWKLEKNRTEISDKVKASKIILHTRNFREYCNHLISKEIDDGVFTLLDDLARFQDRLHQKDPVKARVKRRMVYGIKEIKKHVKLKKLKCIIIAPDLENVETEGGLNDILNDLKCLAADHHIPCIFALGRKKIGQVCRKSVPVSCIGIFSYEGSEVNFKRVIELQSQSLKDYAVLLNRVTQGITKEQASIFIKAKREAPETLSNLRSDFLREIFFPSVAEEQKTVSEDNLK